MASSVRLSVFCKKVLCLTTVLSFSCQQMIFAGPQPQAMEVQDHPFIQLSESPVSSLPEMPAETKTPPTSLDFLWESSPISRVSSAQSLSAGAPAWMSAIQMVVGDGSKITGARTITVHLSGVDGVSSDLEVRYAFNSLDESAFSGWQNFAKDLTLELPDWEGINYINLKVRDKDGNEQLLWDSIRLDRTAPAVSMTLNGGDPVTMGRQVRVDLTAVDDGSGLSEICYAVNRTDPSAFSAWEPFSASKTIVIPNWAGTNYVNFRVRDKVGNETFVWQAIEYAPVNASAAVNSGETSTAKREAWVNLVGFSGNTGHLEMCFALNSLDPSAFTSWEAFQTTKTLTLPDYPGLNYVNVKVRDPFGNEVFFWDSINFQRARINGGKTATASRDVTVEMNLGVALRAGTEMSFALNSWADADFSVWEPYADTKAWQISNFEGPNYINVRFRDANGQIYAYLWDSILLDRTAPAVSLLLNQGGGLTNNRSVTAHLTAEDAGGSGPFEMSYALNSLDESAYSAWEAFSPTKTIEIPDWEGRNYVNFRVRDVAGNISWAWQGIVLDQTAPQVSVLSPSLTNSSSYILEYQIFDNFDSPRTLSSSYPLWQGINTFNWQVTDAAGNVREMTHQVSYVPVSNLFDTYNATDVDYQWIATSQPTGLTLLDQNKNFVLPFSFNYFGQTYSQIQVSTKGLIQFGSCNSCNDWSPDTIPNTAAPNNIVAVFWRDLNVAAGGVITYESTPNRFVVSWDNVRNHSSVYNDPQRFQLILNSDGSIIFQYASVSSGMTTSIGLENSTGTKGVRYNVFPSNQKAIQFTPHTPWNGTLSVNQGAAYTTSRDVSVSVAGTSPNGPVAAMRFSLDGGMSWTPWEAFSDTKTLSLGAGDGLKGVSCQLRDSLGSVATAGDMIFLDTTPPTGTVSIHGGANYTSSPSITLTLTGTDYGSGMDQMSFSVDGGQTWSDWENFAVSKIFSLPGGDGEKEVRARFKDKAGHVSGVVSDTIILDSAFRILESNQDVRKTIVLGALTDADGQPLTYQYNAPSNLLQNGQFILRQNQLTYVPAKNFTGYGEIIIQVSGAGGTVQHAVGLRIKAPQVNTPNDPDLNRQYGLTLTNAFRAWNLSRGSGVTVAVIDTGVDMAHPDLNDNLFTNAGEIADDGIDNDGNGFVDDVHGWDFGDGDDTPSDIYGHGTHVAGIIAAESNNGLGGSGMASAAKLMAVKIVGTLTTDMNDVFDKVKSGIQYAVQMGVKVINLSLGCLITDLSGTIAHRLQEAITAAWSAGVIVVAAAGNDYSDVGLYTPAALDHVITVAATDDLDGRASDENGIYFSNYGEEIDVSAPGENVYSTYWDTTSGSTYGSGSGTSMSAPFVAGLAAMLVSQDPSATYDDVMRRLKFSSKDLGASGHDIYYGYGRMDAFKALAYDYYDDGTVKTQYLEAPDENGWNRLSFDTNGYLTGGTFVGLSGAAGVGAGLLGL